MEKKWLNEPNFEHFIHSKLDCLIIRSPGFKTLCGYAGVKKDHPFFGMDSKEVRPFLEKIPHEGLTFCGDLPELPHVWFFGFDCAHGGDLVPGLELFLNEYPELSKGVYRDWDFVKTETEDLAKQLFLGRTKHLFSQPNQ